MGFRCRRSASGRIDVRSGRRHPRGGAGAAVVHRHVVGRRCGAVPSTVRHPVADAVRLQMSVGPVVILILCRPAGCTVLLENIDWMDGSDAAANARHTPSPRGREASAFSTSSMTRQRVALEIPVPSSAMVTRMGTYPARRLKRRCARECCSVAVCSVSSHTPTHAFSASDARAEPCDAYLSRRLALSCHRKHVHL